MNTLDLQRALIRLGYDPGYPDGVDGPKTLAALACAVGVYEAFKHHP